LGVQTDFCRVRRQRMQMWMVLTPPPSLRRRERTLGEKCRLVRRLEWLTLCQKRTFLPQISHFIPAYLNKRPGCRISSCRGQGKA